MRSMYGPEIRFLACPPVDLRDAESVAESDVVIIGAPFDSGTSYRSGARFGPQAIRAADYNPHVPTRPSLALGVDPFEILSIARSEEHTSELQSRRDLVCRLLLE